MLNPNAPRSPMSSLSKIVDGFRRISKPETLHEVFNIIDHEKVVEELELYLKAHPNESEDAAAIIIATLNRDFNSALPFILKRMTPESIAQLIKKTRSRPAGSFRDQRALLFKHGGYTQDVKDDLVTLIKDCKLHGDLHNLEMLEEAKTRKEESLIKFATNEDLVDSGDGRVVFNVNAPFLDNETYKTYKTYLHFVAVRLYYTPIRDFIGVASFFLKHGAFTNIQDDSGCTVLHTAVMREGADGLSEFISEMKKYNRSLVELDYKMRTPMELAKECGKFKAAEELSKAGAAH